VREALKILTTMGLVEIRRGDGAYVSAPSRLWSLQAPAFTLATEKNALRDIVELRRSVEPMAALLAAERATDEDISDLQALLEEHQEPLSFELAITESTGNVLLVQMQQMLRDLWVGLSTDFRSTVDHTVEWLHEHWVILDAIKAHNPMRARDAVLLHLDLGRFEQDLSR
jgi:GntR family transcriptional repressor for pyruvate dehydrogenase complex